MIQEIPYGVYSDTNDNSCESKEINVIPISIEVVPHKAIVIYDANPVIINQPSRSHACLFVFFCCVVTMGFLIIVLSFSNEIIHDKVY